MIEVKNLTKSYGSFVAVKGISFKAESGQILGFLGPNGLDIFTNSLEARRLIGYLPENPPLYSDMRVDGYLKFVAKLRGVRRSEVEAATDHMIEVCGLSH